MEGYKRVFATIGSNQVVQGFYVIRGNILTMTYGPNGKPVLLDDAPVTAKLAPGSNPDAVARMLAKKIRRLMLGETVPGFNRVIDYDSAPEPEYGTGFNRALSYVNDGIV